MHADVVDGADPGVASELGGAGLEAEAVERLLVADGVCRQDLHRHLPPEAFVLGQVDDTHAAGAERAQDPVVRQGLADHRCGLIQAHAKRQV